MTITRRLFFIQLFIALVLVSGMFLFVQWSFDRGFIRYIDEREQQITDSLVDELATVYTADGGWDKLASSPVRWLQLVTSVVGMPLTGKRLERRAQHIIDQGWPPKQAQKPPEGVPEPLELRMRLLDAQSKVIYGSADEPLSELVLYPVIIDNGVTVGFLGLVKDKTVFSAAHDLQFSEQQNQAYFMIALVMLLLSVGVALPLAHHLVGPIKDLTLATRRLASGDYTARIEHQSNDEVGQLARDFNELALTLSNNEALRRRWVADISHELRTPLSILLGEIDALRDGVYTLDDNALGSLHQEAQLMSRLINDLYELSMSDIGALDYHKVPLDLGAAARDALEGFSPGLTEKSIRVETHGLDDIRAVVFADPDRIDQLLSNLLQNTLRYTDANGCARMTLTQRDKRVYLTLEDSAPAVQASELPKLFDRLYRADSSRNRKTGGTGLGLAICQNIAEAHTGILTVALSSLGGLCFTIELPLIMEETV
ncbi:HAMP domain-containing protein [Amphritea opalescens]|uniref:histidine kinase n=1 Tax=Amphritea opalescens TaxID=2490544 RepID=A0A430KNZ0_9GAMM|nr:ATP-binding protein [Amphritea opalescens]RTE65114.1 HAMP domain-containing protein [Amphritea opalescens]